MSLLVKCVGYALLVLFLGIVLRELGFRGARLVSLVCSVGIIGAAVGGIGELGDLLGDVWNGISSDSVIAVVKIIGVGYVSGVCADVCSEFGENVLSGALTTLGKVEMLIISAPSIISIVDAGVELIGV